MGCKFFNELVNIGNAIPRAPTAQHTAISPTNYFCVN